MSTGDNERGVCNQEEYIPPLFSLTDQSAPARPASPYGQPTPHCGTAVAFEVHFTRSCFASASRSVIPLSSLPVTNDSFDYGRFLQGRRDRVKRGAFHDRASPATTSTAVLRLELNPLLRWHPGLCSTGLDDQGSCTGLQSIGTKAAALFH